MKKHSLILIAVVGLFATTFSSCKKAAQQSSITYVNDTYTPVNITVGGSSQTIAVGGSVTFIANVGTDVNVTASTSGSYGLSVPWSFPDTFPQVSGDNISETIDVPAEYFYLKAVNTYTAATVSLIVNLGLTAQTNENMTIPNDGNTYGIGYYYGFSNTEIKATYTDNSTLLITGITIPNTLNASYTASL